MNQNSQNWEAVGIQTWRSLSWILTGLTLVGIIGLGVAYASLPLIVMGSVLAGLSAVRLVGAAVLRFLLKRAGYFQSEHSIRQYTLSLAFPFLRDHWLDVRTVLGRAPSSPKYHTFWEVLMLSQPIYWLAILSLSIASIVLIYQTGTVFAGTVLALFLLNMTVASVSFYAMLLGGLTAPDVKPIKWGMALGYTVAAGFGFDLIILAITLPVAWQAGAFAVGGILFSSGVAYLFFHVARQFAKDYAHPRFAKIASRAQRFFELLSLPELLIAVTMVTAWTIGLVTLPIAAIVAGTITLGYLKRKFLPNLTKSLGFRFSLLGPSLHDNVEFEYSEDKATRQKGIYKNPTKLYDAMSYIEYGLLLATTAVVLINVFLPGVFSFDLMVGVLGMLSGAWLVTLFLPKLFAKRIWTDDLQYKKITITDELVSQKLISAVFPQDAVKGVPAIAGKKTVEKGLFGEPDFEDIAGNAMTDQFGQTFLEGTITRQVSRCPVNRHPYFNDSAKTVKNQVLINQARRFLAKEKQLFAQAKAFVTTCRQQGMDDNDILPLLKDRCFALHIEQGVIQPDVDFPKYDNGELVLDTGVLIVDPTTGLTRLAEMSDRMITLNKTDANGYRNGTGATVPMYRSLAVEEQITQYKHYWANSLVKEPVGANKAKNSGSFFGNPLKSFLRSASKKQEHEQQEKRSVSNPLTSNAVT